MTVQNSDYTPPGEGKWRFTGYHMVACVVAFFAVIISVNLTMAWLASNSWTGLVVKSSYVANQEFNDNLAAARKQKARGWKSTFTYSNNIVGLKLLDRDGAPVAIEKIAISFGRPVSQSLDTELVLNKTDGGNYRAELKLAPGIWLFKALSTGAVSYRLEGRLLVSKNGQGRLK